jgi:hypothetical protein
MLSHGLQFTRFHGNISKYRFCMSYAATSRRLKVVYSFYHSEKTKGTFAPTAKCQLQTVQETGHAGLGLLACLPYIAQIALLRSGVISCVAATQEQRHLIRSGIRHMHVRTDCRS